MSLSKMRVQSDASVGFSQICRMIVFALRLCTVSDDAKAKRRTGWSENASKTLESLEIEGLPLGGT
jgi:hypothetical protein